MNATTGIGRLLAPRSLALIGGAWADAAHAANRALGFKGEIWRVHPTRSSDAQQRYFRSIDELPAAPDAAFVAAPAADVPEIAGALARRGAGGFVCFAAGFSETATPRGEELTRQLLAQAGALPFLGPNCYGFINFFDGAALWPDQVVGGRPERGVALICQSGTIALNLLFGDRSLPIGYLLTVGNQTRLAAEDLIDLLAADARVTAIGLYLEGVRDGAHFVGAIQRARAAGKPIALVKAGRTEVAAATVRTHTGALAGADAAFDALCRQLGVARCESLATLCETLKIFHSGGPLPGNHLMLLGASGGDMATCADLARELPLQFPEIPAREAARLGEIMSDKVQVANPFDFHSHAWFDLPRLREMFGVTQQLGFDATAFMISCPPAGSDDRAYTGVIDQFIAAVQAAGTRGALLSALPESLSVATRARCLERGIAPLQGQREGLEALALAAAVGRAWGSASTVELCLPRRARGVAGPARAVAPPLDEFAAKEALAAHGVPIPRSRRVTPEAAAAAAEAIGFPVVLKAVDAALEHKSEAGGVILDVRTAQQAHAGAQRLARLCAHILVEEMIGDGVAEVLVGIGVDPQWGQTLVLGAGGVLTELLRDTVTLLPPFTAAAIEAALQQLRLWPLLRGFRGRPAADLPALVAVALACARYAAAHVDTLAGLDVNPVIVRPPGRGAVAVDALIRFA
ncbi:MAG: acetate--CoA ligase family protein [Proteobacteria bacterium]|nr:acetate--CoA ligase family protein [Pseudomonadota bacterium]